MVKHEITIHQTLHGYSNGHHLLQSSVLLSEESKQKMDVLSDFTNIEITKDFTAYFTGYYLEKERLLVLSKTWYAFEMIRPGCVWTHSLLINIDDLQYCSQNIIDILSLYIRPNRENEFISYSRSINIALSEDKQKDYDNKKLQYLIWIVLGQEPPNCIFSDNPEEYIKELLFILLNCYNLLSYNFSFITATSSIKKENSEILSLQFCARNARNNMLSFDNEITFINNINDVQKFPLWVTNVLDLLLDNGWDDFLKFRNMFSKNNQYSLSLTNYIKLYSCFYGMKKNIDIYAALEFMDKVLDDKKALLGSDFLGFYFEGSFDYWGKDHSYSNLLIASLKFSWLRLDTATLSLLIEHTFKHDLEVSKRIVQFLANLDNPQIQEKYIVIFAQLLTPDLLESFTKMDYSVCNVLISTNPKLAKCTAIWHQPYFFQQGIFDCLKSRKELVLSDKSLLNMVLSKSIFDFADELYYIWEEYSIHVFLNYLLGFEKLAHNDTKKMLTICKINSNIAAQRLTSNNNTLTSNQLLVFISIVNQYSDNVSFETLVKIFFDIQVNLLSTSQKNEVADWYLPFILRYNCTFPEEIISFAILNVHDRLSKFPYPDEKWRNLKMLLPDAGFYNQWDKCKRLRKALKKKGIKINQLNEYNDDAIDIHLL